MISIAEAKKYILADIKSAKAEGVALKQSLGRVLAEEVFADRDYPPFNRATMDGFAIHSKSFTNNQIKNFTIKDTIIAGEQKEISLQENECIRIMTGAPVPESANVVIKIEDCILTDNQVSFKQGTTIVAGKNIAQQGEDSQQGRPLLKPGIKINQSVYSLLATLGHTNVTVYQPPRVSIISTGDEIVAPDIIPKAYQIRDSNSYTIAAFLDNFLIKPYRIIRATDSKDIQEKAIETSLDSDIIFISGGVSMGDKDMIPSILLKLGIEKMFHKVKVKPGKPIWFGRHKTGTVVFALPGNPVACQVLCKVLVEPYIRRYLSLPEETTLRLPLNQERKKKGDRPEYFPCKIVNGDGISMLEPLKNNGSGDVKATCFSDGLAFHPEEIGTIHKEDNVIFQFWSSQ